MNYFCTFFDINYLPHGLALYQSLKEHCPEFRLWTLCMDSDSHEVLSQMALPELRLIKLDDFQRGDESLLRAKQNRSKLEYYFTCKPSLPLYVLNNFPEVDLITYIEADLYFYSDQEQIIKEIGDHSIAIIEHRYAPQYKEMEICGKYNVGWLSFRRDENGLACLNWWRDRCNEWCYKRHEDGKFADQKYLDDWLARFKNVIVIQHKGANLASWNIENYKISGENHKIWIDGQELIFFHFHGFKQLTKSIYSPGYHQTKANKFIRDNIYRRYLQADLRIRNELKVKESYGSQLQDVITRSSTPNDATVHERIRGYLSALYRVLISGNYVRMSEIDKI
jgi:hypothetical protein